jgi:peptide deformylase
MPRFLDISQLGSPVIRTLAQTVSDIQAPAFQSLIDDMILTCKESKGVGLAAPQVGHSLCVLIMASYPNPRYPNAPLMEPTALINPRVLSFSEEKVKEWEGCLSVPGIRALVPRHTHIEVAYFDREGREVRACFDGFLARLFQHEYDHLIGKVFIDRIESTQELITEKEYQRLMSLN